MISPLFAALACACIFQTASARNDEQKSLHKRATLSPSLGLSQNNLNKNGVALGFLPGWGEPMEPNNCTSINAKLPQPMSVVGRPVKSVHAKRQVGLYVQIKASDPTFSQIDFYMTDVYNQPGDLPVVNLALMPIEGLDTITQEVANNIGAKMAEINSKGVTVWLRYAHEMNGDWYPYGQKPEQFVPSFQMVAEAVHAQAQDTYMLFAPNSMYAFDYNLANPIGGYEPYWPGKDHVDLVGLSFYTYGTWYRLNILPPDNMAVDTLRQFDNLYGSAMNLSMVLAETGASFTYMVDTWQPAEGNATESAIKFNWLWQLLGTPTIEVLPSIKAITWFEVVKIENAGAGTIPKIEDFRLVVGNSTVEQGAIDFFHQANTINRPVGGTASSSSGDAASTPGATAAKSAALPLLSLKSSLLSVLIATGALLLVCA